MFYLVFSINVVGAVVNQTAYRDSISNDAITGYRRHEGCGLKK